MKHRLLCSAAGVGGPRGGPVCKGPRPAYSRPKLLQAPRAPGTHEGPTSPIARGPGPKSAGWLPPALGSPTLSLSPRVPIWKMGRMGQAVPWPPAGLPCTDLSCIVEGASGARAVFLNWPAGSPGTEQKPHGGTGVNSLQAAAGSTASRRPQTTPWAGTDPVAAAQDCGRPAGTCQPATPQGAADTVSWSRAGREPEPTWDSGAGAFPEFLNSSPPGCMFSPLPPGGERAAWGTFRAHLWEPDSPGFKSCSLSC